MAKGKKCPKCTTPMYALREDKQANGKYRVTYICSNGNCKHSLTEFEN